MKGVKFATRMLYGRLPAGRRYCVVCEHNVWAFIPFRGGKASKFMEALDVVGSNIANFECPRCGAHDRERHLYLYIRATDLLREMTGKVILHFAPERHLPNLIVTTKPKQHIKCDLFPKAKDVQKVDITNMLFESGSCDFLIANHVLEHVASDLQALSEIHRVLKPGGIAILQTPYSRKLLNTWDDGGITDEGARNQAFGQEDHVRLYGRDIFARITSSGLIPDVRTHVDLLPEVDAWKMGVNPAEPFFLFRKPREVTGSEYSAARH